MVTTAYGVTSEIINTSNQDVLGANSGPSDPDSEVATTFTTIWQWVGGGAPQDPYTLYAHGDLTGSGGGQNGATFTASAMVDARPDIL